MRNIETIIGMPNSAVKDDEIMTFPAGNCQSSRACADNWRMPREAKPRCQQRRRVEAPLLAVSLLTGKSNKNFYNGMFLRFARRHRAFLAGAFLAIVLALFLFKNNATPVCAHLDRELYYCSVQVQEGDTIWSIAEEHMTEEWSSTREYVKAIKKLNQKKSDFIYAGMYLSIPYYQ